MFKKSQAALEFLTTYAWAFLVIIIMVAALTYFGILSPSKLLPDRCNFGSEISCDKNRMIVNNVNENTVAMQLTNSFGSAVVVTAATMDTDVATIGTCTAQINNAAISNYNWGTGDLLTLNADCTGGANLAEGIKVKMRFEISYYEAAAGSGYTKIIFGEIYTSVQ